MSKTQSEIKDEIIAAKESYAELDVFTLESKVDPLRLIIDVVAQVISFLYAFFDTYKVEITDIVDRGYFGSSAWFTNEVKKFQFGYDLIFEFDEITSTAKYYYEVDDADSRIVQQVALETIGDLTLIKIAKLDNNELAALSAEELLSLTSYIRLISYPGMFFNVLSNDADLLVLNYRVYFNALQGEDVVKSNIEIAIHNYLNNIVFNGKLELSSAIDAIQAVNGVKSVYSTYASGRGSETDLQDATVFTESYNSVAGYMNIDTLTIEMIPE